MAQTRQINRLDELMDGALTERFNYELERVLNNVFDQNTNPKAKRQIQIVIDIVPNERRDAAEFKIDVKSKTAPPVAVAQTVFLAMDDYGNVTATEMTNQVPGQIKGKADIIKQGGNEEIYAFSADTNLVSSKDSYSMTDLVTRVVITGKEDSSGRPKVEATIDGKTEYGILQAVKARGSSTLADAKKEAQELIDEKGTPTRKILLHSPEFPLIRKGDKIHATLDGINGFFHVLGVTHNATTMQMQMEVEPA